VLRETLIWMVERSVPSGWSFPSDLQ